MLFNRRHFLFPVSLIIIIQLAGSTLMSQDTGSGGIDIYLLKDSVIIHVTEKGAEPLQLGGDVVAMQQEGGDVYYVRRDGQGFTAGIYSPQGLCEYQLLHESYRVERFAVHDGEFYILFMKPGGGPGMGGELLRVNSSTGKTETAQKVWDFCFAGGYTCVIMERALWYENSSIPLMLEGDLYIKDVVDGRLVVVSNGSGSEVCDVIACRNIYQYEEGGVYPVNDDYNLVIEFCDTGAGSGADAEGSMVYYNVIVDGSEGERTGTAPGRAVKSLYLKLQPGRFYLIRPERWELDRGRGKYVRVNNIKQPGELKVYIPENRGIKIIVEFDGKQYNVKKGVYSGNEKPEGE